MADVLRVNQLTYHNVNHVQIAVTSDDGSMVRYLVTLSDWSRAIGKLGVDVPVKCERSRVE